MKKAGKTEDIRVFLDSSVFIAATLSMTGGSFRLCKEGNERRLMLITNRYVSDEVRGVLLRKYPRKIEDFEKLLKWSRAEIQKYPTAKSVQNVAHLINDKNDAPILAGAIFAKAHFIATLDRNDFFTDTLQNARLPLVIVTPGTFFQEYF